MSTDSYEQASRDFDSAEAMLQAAETADGDVALDFLATLSPFDYERTRKNEAQRLNVRLAELDRAVAKRREQLVSSSKPSGEGFQLVDFEPSKEPVNGERMISRLIETIERYVVLPSHGAVAVALWIVRAHAFECFDINPRLAFLSPEKRCGKSTALEVVSAVTPRAILASNATPASLFRLIEAVKPTLILDEMDTFKDSHPELRGILNSGHRRSAAYVLRCEGDEHTPKAFSTWAPMVFAAIGKLPDTLEDRSIIARMRRRAKSEIVHRLQWTGQRGKALRASLTTLGQGVARWVQDHADAMQQHDPAIPEQLHDRAADNWASLLTIADTIGGEWPEKARVAAIALSGTYEADDDSSRVQLLHDVRGMFEECKTATLPSKVLCRQLATLEERPWASWRQGRALSPVQLSRLLRPFDIRSRDVWDQKRNVKSYVIEDFTDAFERYLPPLSSRPLTPGVLKREAARTRARSEDHVDIPSASTSVPRASKSAPIAAPDKASRVLADQNGGSSGKDQRNARRAHLTELSKAWKRVKSINPMR